ncbi:chemotaxis protein CheB [Methylotuvimicrobium buryatense]|uniref:protein-glutamate O-methyltransferase n=1 Tax=Methylotuvimicrobium buryatense TaxID=95641 RepID=A0A4P9UPW8_METBY|nr:chemotaxis protein CheB [Methylotuvimicrobium buryatense]QCW82281.1 PAS domain-containing protein [Methylotuvimicrobium buryatense]
MARNKKYSRRVIASGVATPIEDPLDLSQIPTLNPSPKTTRLFNGYVVAIGASAGGLDALERFFDKLSVTSGAAFVVVQHLSPDHKSMMDNLLARHTAMPVLMAENGMQIKPNQVFLIPPGKNMTVAGSQLRLLPKNPHGLSLPIDLFFTSLSKEFGKHSVGVILSGTGSDGTRGAVAINDAGGFLLAQDPETAKFDGMPRSVIATGLVDEVIPPEMLAARIVGHVSNSIQPTVKLNDTGQTSHGDPLENILHLLYQVGGINFKEYKSATVQRRIERRMQVRHVRDLSNYLYLLESDRNEIITLKRDILIPVTSYFRDVETFELLEKTVIQTLVENNPDNQSLRVWVAGCATGEEAYTLSILFAEAFDKLRRWPQLKIFATDVEQQNIEFASAGVYPEAIANELSPERLERFFSRSGNQFIVKNEIRQNIVFARHNILDDPPFTRMNLVSCRNTLIYFDVAAQERALLCFQYALAHNGYLLLGSSESLGTLHKDFSVINAKHKIYRVLRPVSLPLNFKNSTNHNDNRMRVSQPYREKHRNAESSIIESGQMLLMQSYAPPALLINEERELVHVYGDVQRYMQIQAGSASLEISKLLVGKMAPVCVALLHKVAKDNMPLHSEIQLLDSAKKQSEWVRVVLRPLIEDAPKERHFLMSFEVLAPKEIPLAGSNNIDVEAVSNDRIQSLEMELSATRDSLQATIEELETSNEELQATNEELMASNEELQSTNEELQSVNEELYTVNAENQEKIDILNRLNADLDNMTRAALIPTLFVDSDLNLTRFTPEAGSIFRIREGDIGRPIDDFAHEMEYPEFLHDLRRVICTAQLMEREVKTRNDHWYLVRVLPYIDRPRNISGAVLTFVDITQIKDAQRLQAILDSLPEHIAVLNSKGVITMVNKAWRDFAQSNGDRELAHTGPGINYLDVCKIKHVLDDTVAHQVLIGISQILSGEQAHFSIKYPCHSPTERRWFLMHATPVRHPLGGIIVSHVNITAWVEGEQA